ncbi:polymorphic toxin-type HINT domain-containing protein [Micromonospora sp. NPDC047762]|uniref:polymorphic toxin-type HINT domain-containing protein n=1 Tax=Micromonospora sp. NPDC047762 TaxID=3364255 RepID=UPI00370F7C5E
MPNSPALLSRPRRLIALSSIAVLVASTLTVPQAAQASQVPSGDRPVKATKAETVRRVPVDRTPLPDDGGRWAGPKHATWPKAGAATLAVAETRRERQLDGDRQSASAVRGLAGGLPVKASAVTGKRVPTQARVELLDEQHSRRLGVSGPVVVVNGDAGTVDAAFDYAEIRQLYGAGWGERLTLKRLPACAATTPQRSECQETGRVDATNDPATSTLSTRVDLSGAAPMVFAITAEESSEEGDYKATDLKASGSWTAGDSSGGFSYSNPLRLPPAEGPLPEMSLDYSSQVVDGRMAGANNQASWVGDGWDYAPGFIERTYATCTDDRDAVAGKDPNNKDKKTYDQCWKGDSPNVTVSLNGTNASLIKDDVSGVWRAQSDSNWRIQLDGSPATSGSATTERWTVTTPDGTRYFFAGEAAATDSRWTIPVFGNHSGEDCHATAFKDSSCKQAWRWMLDKTVDVHGNTVRYYYQGETGHYGAADDKDNRQSFTRGGYLTRIDYGLHANYSSVAATGRVVFSVADRCLATECHKDGKPVKANWPDVPWDKECDAVPCTDKLAPVFFSTKRLTKITTQVRDGSAFPDVESWSLSHEFKAPKVAGSASLWLKEIVHAGHVGGLVTDPPVQFTGVELVNRANVLAGAPLFSRWRIQNIRTESGADIHVTYSDADCDLNDLPGSPETNSRLCYPVYWTPDGYTDPKRDWFHKYVVTEISEIDRTADQPAITTRYEYSTDGGGTSVLWGYDDGEFTKKKHRTYGQWRGYSQVVTKVGEPGRGVPLTTRKRFYRGLDDQPLPGGGRRNVLVSDSESTTFSDHPALAGSPLEEATLDGSDVVEASTTQYWTRQTAARTHTGGTDRAYFTGPSVVKTRKLLAPNKWARTETRTTYDLEDGQPETVSELGDTARTGDETCSTTTYVKNGTAWIRAAVSRVETVAKSCGATVNRPADVISDVKTYHDGSDTHGSAPTKGLVTREDTLDTWNGGPVYATTSRSSYDALGRIGSATDARGGVTTTTYTPAGPGPVTQTVTLNPLQHKTTTTQQPAWAEPTAVVDANDKRTDLAHDPLGRLTKVWLPGRAKATKTPNLEFGYRVRADGPLAVTTKRLGPNETYISEIGLFDSLYRPVQTQEDSLGGKRLVESTGYNDRGLEAYRAGPAYVTGVPAIELLQLNPGEDRVRTVLSHDAVGRVVNEGTWSGHSQLWATVTSYGGNPDGWQVSVTPPRGGTATATISDAQAQTTELRQFHGITPSGGYDATKYTYTPRGDLATVTGPTGKVWEYGYDLRGREVRTVDPDKGETNLTYDNDDDVTSSKNALDDVVSTEYDALGRQKKRLVNGQLAAEWAYDTVAKGHLSKQVSTVDGHQFVREIFAYSDAYQVADEEARIPAMPGLGTAAGTYVSTYTFKADGSPDRMNVPKTGALERETIGHTYDDLGNVTRLVGTSYPSGTNTVYVDAATYSPYGEVLKRTLGVNNKPQAYQTYVYDDPTRRLKEFYFDRDATVNNVAALSYDYDHEGNVLSMANTPLDNDDKPRPGDSDVQCFQYDQLRRLTQAWTQATTTCAAEPTAGAISGKSPYWKAYAYHADGSRKSVTDRRTGVASDYGYAAANAAQPHAVRTVTTGSRVDHYDWDATGNLTYRKVDGVTENLEWNPQGKLQKITGPGGATRMVYDADGNRIARIDPNGQATVFVAGQELVVQGQDTTATRYYQHAGDTVASRAASTATGPKDLTWLAADQHDSAHWAVNSVTRVDTVRYSDPFGNARSGGTGGTWPSGQRGFVGGISDPTGLSLLGARFYDAALGAFISVDPETDEYDPQRMHPFAYANNNPVTFADPDGLFFGKIKNAASRAANAVANTAKSAVKAVVDNAGTISAVAGGIAMVAAVLPPPAQVVAAAAAAVSAVAGAIDTAKTCKGGDTAGCAMGIASMVPGVRQAKTAARGAGAVKKAVKGKRPSGCNSFLPGTPVLMADGSYKAIEEIQLDDVVWAADPESGKDGARPVTALITGSGQKTLVDISIDSDSDGVADGTVTATDGHPFWVSNQHEWLRAEHLKQGDLLLSPDGARVSVIAVVAYGAVATVHNLTVDDIHTYHVLVGDTDVLVHNQGGLDEICELDARDIHFTQDSASNQFSDHPGTLLEMAEDLKRGKKLNIPAIRVFEENGKMYTLDNRRLLAYQIANKPIRTKKATGREVFKDRFDPSKKKRKNTEIDGGNRITLKSSSRNPQWQRTWHKRLGWDA